MTPRRTYLFSIYTLACSKAESVLENMNLFYLAQNHSSVTRVPVGMHVFHINSIETICLYMSDVQYH